jgi:hypothetical protein
MRKLFIIFPLFFSAILLSAQVPGYQGKRAAIEVIAMPALATFLVGDAVFPTGFKVHGEYAIKRHKSIGLEYRQMRFGPKYSEQLGSPFADYNNQSFMLLYCNYNKEWSLAPYGHYINYGLAYNRRSLQLGSKDDPFLVKENFFSLHLIWGKRTVFAKRLSFNYGFETGVPLRADIFGGSTTNPASIDWSLMALNLNVALGFIF